MSDLTPAQRVAVARHLQRPNITDYIGTLFTDFFEQHGDRLSGEDGAVLGGIALYHGRPVTVIGTRKGRTAAVRSLHSSIPPGPIPAWRPRPRARGRPSPGISLR